MKDFNIIPGQQGSGGDVWDNPADDREDGRDQWFPGICGLAQPGMV